MVFTSAPDLYCHIAVTAVSVHPDHLRVAVALDAPGAKPIVVDLPRNEALDTFIGERRTPNGFIDSHALARTIRIRRLCAEFLWENQRDALNAAFANLDLNEQKPL